ncbi:MAG: sporulation protein [Parcubacteria group bacterium]|nr:sporulation protein [Parcubacteria group bacterium]
MNTLRNHFWNIFLSLFFALLLAAGIWYLTSIGAFYRNLGIADLLLMSLAVWRLTRLFVYDAITKFIRDWFVGARPESLRGTLHTLLNCPWCTGLWFGATVMFFYFLTPYTWPVVVVLAIAALGSFFQILSNLVGWSAEYKKTQTQLLQANAQTHVEAPKC